MRSPFLRPAPWGLCALVLLLSVGEARAQRVTVAEILELVRAGVSDDVVTALVETSDEPFALDASLILELRAAGVSDRVLVAMLRSGRRRLEAPPDVLAARAAEESSTSRQGHQRAPDATAHRHLYCTHVHAAFVPVPVFVESVGGALLDPRREVVSGFGAAPPVLTGFGAPPPRSSSTGSNGRGQYWGWGGNLRPDAWGQPRSTASTGSPASNGSPPR